jgi:drug/metabolite transporter (DMT)-like permease
MNRTRSSFIYAGLAILFWSTVPTAFKIGLRELEILPMVTIAAFTSTIVMLIFVVAGKKINLLKKTTGKELLSSALLGLINPFIYYLVLLNAYNLLPAQVAQPLNMIWPIVMVFLSVPLLKQKLEKKSFIALLISFSGVYIISSQGNPFSRGHSDLTGVLLALGSSFFWAAYFILNVRDRRDEAIKLFLSFLFGTFYLIAAMLITGKWKIEIGLPGTISAVYIGMFEMGITFLFWLKALQLAPSVARVSNLVYFGPFLSLVFVHLILHEPVYYTTPAGLILIIGGILIQNRKPGV